MDKRVVAGIGVGALVALWLYLRREVPPPAPPPTPPPTPPPPPPEEYYNLLLYARKNPGAGGRTNTMLIETDLGVVGRVESGAIPTTWPPEAGVWAQDSRITLSIPEDTSWVSIRNEDGSALEIRLYPEFYGAVQPNPPEGSGTRLTNILETSEFFKEWIDFWMADYVKLSIP